MKRPQERSPMQRNVEPLIRLEDHEEAAPRKLADRYAKLEKKEPPINYGDDGRFKNDEEQQAPVQLTRAKPPSEPSSMADIKARIAEKRAEKEKGKEAPVRQVRPEFAIERVTDNKEKAAPKVDAAKPSVALGKAEPEQVYEPPIVGIPGEGWVRQGVPSRGIPYADFDDVYVRILEVTDILAIQTSTQNNSLTMFLDALQNAINVDIRSLTYPDFQFLLYWWRLNSFTRSPFTVHWTSRYNNEGAVMINRESDLEIVELKMLPSEYEEYKSKGIDFPRVRDTEYLQNIVLNPSDRWMAERAQYVMCEEQGLNWYPARFELIKKGGLSMMEDIRDFASKIKLYGVVERVKVTDSKFSPEKAIVGLRTSAGKLLRAANLQSMNPEQMTMLRQRAEDFMDEADEIEAKLYTIDDLKSGVIIDGLDKDDIPKLEAELKPKEEVITLRISAMDFFPEI